MWPSETPHIAGLGIMQKAVLHILAPGWRDGFAIWDLGFGIWDFNRGKKGVAGGGAENFATGAFAQWELCKARGEVGFLHNWAPNW